MDTLIIVGVAIVASVILAIIAKRRSGDPPTQPSAHTAPAQLDRDDFDRPDAPWLVAVFTSATCNTCSGVMERAALLESDEVVVCEAEVNDTLALHQRYQITGVPICVIADADGVVVASFVGPVSSTHLWGAIAEARAPGSVPSDCGAAIEGVTDAVTAATDADADGAVDDGSSGDEPSGRPGEPSGD